MAFAVHDGKNMLGALQANVHWLKSVLESGPLSREEVGQAIDDMDTCCDRLSTLLCQALLAARGQKVTPKPSRVHVGALVGHAVQQVRKRAQARGVDVRTTVKGDALAVMDGLLVSRVLDNLLDNALSYSEAGGAVLLEYGTEGDEVYFVVSDQGPGISDGMRERLFEPFVTEKRPTLPETGSHVGLGLAFCKAVAHAHGGEITYTNASSGGAKFTVRLPWLRVSRLSMVPR
jgi:signal transduction histidine kinase